MNVIAHPYLKFHERISNLKKATAKDIILLFFEAHTNSFSREVIVNLINNRDIVSEGYVDISKDLVSWCQSKKIKFNKKLDDSGDPFIEAATPDTDTDKEDLFQIDSRAGGLMDLAIQSMRRLKEASEIVESYAEESKYWFFRPAWQIDNAGWDAVFGNNNPADTIVLYMRAIFEDASHDSKSSSLSAPPETQLTNDDSEVLSWLFASAAKLLSKGARSNPRKASVSDLRRSLVAASGHVISDGLWPEDIDFAEVVNRLPPWLATEAVSAWSRQFPSELDEHQNKEWAGKQVTFIVAMLMQHIGSNHFSELSVPPIENVSNKVYQDVFSTLSGLSSEIDIADYLKDELAKSIIERRDAYFNGTLPIPFKSAGYVFDSLRFLENAHWLTYIVNYGPDHDQDDDPYIIIPWRKIDTNNIGDSSRLNRRAIERFEAYKLAFLQMKDENLDELAEAWWAFFIATQAIAFGSLALPMEKARETIALAQPIIGNVSVTIALRYLLSVENNTKTNIIIRSTSYYINKIFRESTITENIEKSNVLSMGLSQDQAKSWLIERLGPAVWERLHRQSQVDLIDTEQLWSRAYLEYGAGRSDWGAIVTLYARVVESEIRHFAGPLIQSAEASGLCTIKEMTLGGCIAALRDAKNALRKGTIADQKLTSKLVKLQGFFAANAFIAEQRNRAAHGNRELPLNHSDFWRWRNSIFVDGLFAELIESSI